MDDLLQSGMTAWHRGDLLEAEQFFRAQLSSDKTQVAAAINLVAVLSEQQRQPEALDMALSALRAHPRSTGLLCNIGILQATGGAPGAAIEYFRQALEIDPACLPASLNLLNAMLHACDWHGIEQFCASLASLRADNAVAPVQPAWQERVQPYGAVQLALPAQMQKEIADYHASKLAAAWPRLRLPERGRREGKIRLGYLSSDFHDHATSFLASAYLAQHDRDRFTVVCYSCGPQDEGLHARRIRQSVDAFRDMRMLSHEGAAQSILQDRIDVLIDLKGHTGGGRPEIVALHPAPSVVNFLGYPGTMGGSLANVLIGDAVVAPPSHAHLFSEKLVQLDGCYQPNDVYESPSNPPSRASLELPPDKFVFCCLNAHYKISRATFILWMRILREAPDSVLWLLDSSPFSSAHLRAAAGAMGVDAARLVFAPQTDHQTHLARMQVADLFLDTEGVCAHTLASDALRAGVPLLALPGSSFVSRVSTSLLTAVGLEHLACRNEEEYVEQAVKLAGHPRDLAQLRRQLREGTQQSTLFDPVNFCRKFERALESLVMEPGPPHASAP